MDYFLIILIIASSLASCHPANTSVISTQTEAISPSPAFTATQAITMTPFITLEPKQAEQIISKLLQAPVGCNAPCFWQITPGQTTLEEARNIFIRLGLFVKNTTQGYKNFYGIRYDFESGLSLVVTLTIQDEIVKNLRVDITPETQRAGVPREWLVYSPENLIDQYGRPSKVEFSLDRAAPFVSYGMVLYFDDVDLIVEYHGHDLSFENTTFHVCPSVNQFDSVRIWTGKDPQYPPLVAVSLESAASITMDEFSSLMLGNPEEACLSLKAEIFP